MRRLPDELQTVIMSYLRTCDVGGKAASANRCGYCDFNCYYIVKQKQLKYVALGLLILIFTYNISTVCLLLSVVPMLALIETLF